MKTYTDNYKSFEQSSTKEPRFVVKISWDVDDTDHTYLTSSVKANIPAGVDVLHGAVNKISGVTQKINPDIATSTIGSVKLDLLDVYEYENLARYSQDFSQGAWQKTNLSAATAAEYAPDGTYTANKLTYSANFPELNQFYSLGLTLANRSFTYSIWLWTDSGEPTSGTLQIADTSFGDVGSKAITLTTKPTRYSISHTFGPTESDSGVFMRFLGPSTGVVSGNYVYAWGAQLSQTGGRLKYNKTLATAQTQSYAGLTKRISDKLAAGDGLRQKLVRVYVGYGSMPFDEYDQRLTYIVDTISYMDGMYKFSVSDIQREQRHKIFTPNETTLSDNVTEVTERIPLNTTDTSLFQPIPTGKNDSVSPSNFVGYVKIEDEVIQHNGIEFDATIGYYLNVVKRGALNTKPAEHLISDDGTNSSIKVLEHIYIEAAAPKADYSLQTGIYLHGENLLGDVLTADPYDFSTWTTVNTPLVVKSASDTPTGWGKAYDITDNSAANIESVRTEYTAALGYVHGNEYTASVFVKKNALDTVFGGLLIDFRNGFASSYLYITYNVANGSIFASNDGTASVITASHIRDYGDWWQVVLSGYSTTVATTSARIDLQPAVVAASVATKTYFGASVITGTMPGLSVLPKHWHLGIDPKFIRLEDYKTIGVDYWNPVLDTGRVVRIENPGTQDGKKYIEKEILLWMGAFAPIYSNGQLGMKKLANVLPFTGYNAHLTEQNIKSYSDIVHDMKAVINDIRVKWNYVDSKEDFTKENVFIDGDSISKHRLADTKTFEFKSVHTGAHTDENLLSYFDTLRDRYAGPPLRMSVVAQPSMSSLEVGDRVRVTLPQIRNYTDVIETLDRVFEVQQVNTDWTNGNLKLSLFGSSQKAGEITRTSVNSVLLDTFYTSAGTNLTSVLTISGGAVTANGTLTGNASSLNGAIYYYNGDLTINAGVTVTITENVQLRIKGSLIINGKIDGLGRGATGGTSTTQFVGGGTVDSYTLLDNLGSGYDPLKDIDFDRGEQGYIFTTVPAAALRAYGLGTATSIQTTDTFDISSLYMGNGFTFYGETAQKALSQGLVEEVPYYNLQNDQQTNLLSGYPLDIRGNSGGGGVPLMRNGFTSGVWAGQLSIVANGGAGGNGGAGLMIVSRGVVFGGAGTIDLSGGDSSVGGSWTSPGGDTFYAGSGAPGAPGALLILLDGGVTNPDIDSTKFIANFGNYTTAVGATEIDRTFLSLPGQDWNLYTVSTWPHGDAVWNAAPAGALENTSATAAAYRIQYIPADITPAYSDDSAPNISYRTYKPIQVIEGTPSNQNIYLGKSTTISDDNQRWAFSEGEQAFNTSRITIQKGLENGITEATWTLPTTEDLTASRSMHFNNTADVFIEGRPEPNSLAGKVYIWERSNITWTNTQTISWPTAGDLFGRYMAMRGNGRSQGFVVGTEKSSGINQVLYYENTGASWVLQQSLTNPGSLNVLIADAIAMSGNANWILFGDTVYNSNAGAGIVYERTGTGASTWTFRTRLEVVSGVSLNRLGEKCAVDANGQTFVVSSEYPVSGFLRGRVDIWQRDIGTYNHFQTIFGPEDSIGSWNAYFGKALALSDDGLTLAITYANSADLGTIISVYKRGSIDVKFRFFESIEMDGITSVYRGDMVMSRNGNYILIQSPTYRSNGTNQNGIIYIFENQFNLVGN